MGRDLGNAVRLHCKRLSSGDSLRVFCNRLDIRLVHAKPYDPQARGKMERFWRTLRQECLDHLPTDATLHDVQMRLLATIDRAYHVEPHGSLVGQTPEQRWAERPELRQASEQDLLEALTVDVVRRVSKTPLCQGSCRPG